jgi:hypothetical protein
MAREVLIVLLLHLLVLHHLVMHSSKRTNIKSAEANVDLRFQPTLEVEHMNVIV